jgi:dihydroorotase
MVAEKRIWLSTIRRMLAEGPARIFGLRSKGFIVEGMDADFTVIDMRREGVIRGDEFYSRAHYTPFEGFRYRGEAVMTLVGGEVVMDDGEVFKRSGKYIKSVYIEKDEKRI